MGAINDGSFEAQNGVLYSDSNCVITTLNNVPHVMLASSSFNPARLPKEIKPQWKKVTFINLMGSFEKSTNNIRYQLPEWLKLAANLRILRIEDFDVEDFDFLKRFPLEHLILVNVGSANISKLVNEIGEVKSLRYLAGDQLFDVPNTAILKRANDRLEILSEAAYAERLSNGDIPQADYKQIIVE